MSEPRKPTEEFEEALRQARTYGGTGLDFWLPKAREAFTHALEAARREAVKKWGHVARCRCGKHEELCYHNQSGDGCPMIDFRCLPPQEPADGK
jgi:hypothetical protein